MSTLFLAILFFVALACWLLSMAVRATGYARGNIFEVTPKRTRCLICNVDMTAGGEPAQGGICAECGGSAK